MLKCRKCKKIFEGRVSYLCPDCEAEVNEKLDKARELFNRHGLKDADIKYDIDNACFRCVNCDGHWLSYNGENWIQALPSKYVRYKPNPALETDSKEVELSDEYQHNYLKESMEYALCGKGFVKADSGKLQWSLLPFEQLKDVVKVLMIGAKKYTPDNWKKCDDVTRYKDALMRHVISYICGETEDDESHLSHLAHAICNCLFLMYFENTKEDKNDRLK